MVELSNEVAVRTTDCRERILILFVRGTNGFLEKVPVSEVLRSERELYAFVEARPMCCLPSPRRVQAKKAFDRLR